MNQWVEKSLEVATSPGYLDELAKVYPAIPGATRPLAAETKAQIRRLHERKESDKLLSLLLGIARTGSNPFVIEHPYASIFRQKPELERLNPRVFSTLAGIIQNMEYGEIIHGVERPIDLNRQLGPVFKNWARDHFTKKGLDVYDDVKRFERSSGRALFLGGDTTIRKFAEGKFRGVKVGNRDFIYRTGGKYVVGEARFLSTAGGSQTRDVGITAGFAKGATKAEREDEVLFEEEDEEPEELLMVAVVDGIVWFDDTYLATLKGLKDEQNAMSVLLLEDFLKSLG